MVIHAHRLMEVGEINNEPQRIETGIPEQGPIQKKKIMTRSKRMSKCQEEQRKKTAMSYSAKPGCASTCRRSEKCSALFPEDERQHINQMYWSLDYSGRNTFVVERVNQCPIQRQRVNKTNDDSKKNFLMNIL